MEKELTLRSKHFSAKVILSILFFSLLYGIIRYHFVGGIPWKELPFFIMNKAVALNGMILLIFTFTIGPLKNLGLPVSTNWMRARKALGIAGFISVFIHMIMSLMLFHPAYYAKFFEPDGRMTLNSGLSMLFGVLAFAVLWFYNLSFYKPGKDKEVTKVIKSRQFLLLVMPFAAVHLFFMGFKGWLNPAGWQGGIPPISLIAFTLFVVGYLINLIGRK